MKVFNLYLFSKYRRELMGASAIGIILCHAYGNDVNLPTPFYQLLSLGALGTLMFFFLSGYGLFFSLKNRAVSLGQWYINRFLKLFIPYSIVYIPFLIFTIIKGECDIWTAILRWSTIGYWLGKGGAWFVDFLVPLYLVIPLCYEIVERCKYRWLPISGIMIAMIILANLFPNYGVALEKGMFFFLGYWIAPYSKSHINVKWISVFCLSLLLAGICYFIPDLLVLSWFWPFFFIGMMTICFLLEYKSFIWLKNMFAFMGGICFESYLFTTSLGGVIPFFYVSFLGFDITRGNYLRYFLIIVVGILLSYVFNRFNSKAIKKVVG